MKEPSEDTLFSVQNEETPLAARMRPKGFADLVGQKHFINARFHKLVETDRWTGLIFWGPPGSGKTSLANVIASATKRPFHTISAVTSGVKEIREVLDLSKKDVGSGRPAHILFIDEVHRLNKAQQDVLLPYLEAGQVRFIGATTENPSFEINNAIASRSVIFHFNALSQDEIVEVLKRSRKGDIDDEVLAQIANVALGDARRALTLLENLELVSDGKRVTSQDFDELKHSQSLYYDKKSEQHYDTISAFIKSIRGSDPDAAVYYLARMIEGGEDPLFIARRLVIVASEDIGNANPQALTLATSAFQAVDSIGMPEARIILSQATTYLAACPKSNRSYVAIEKALETVKRTGNLEIPLSIRNAPTKLMKDWGYGKDYQYAHKDARGWIPHQFLPDALKEEQFYVPSEHGQEGKIKESLERRGKKYLDKNADPGGA